MQTVKYKNKIATKTPYDGYYALEEGVILTVFVKGGRGKKDYSNPRECKYKIDKDGYKEYCFSVNGTRKFRRGHRVIWETFKGEIPHGLTIDHINNIEGDNRLSNLQLMTREKNAVKRDYSWIESKRNHYNVYVDSQYQGVFDRFQIINEGWLNAYDIALFDSGKSSRHYRSSGVVLEKV